MQLDLAPRPTPLRSVRRRRPRETLLRALDAFAWRVRKAAEPDGLDLGLILRSPRPFARDAGTDHLFSFLREIENGKAPTRGAAHLESALRDCAARGLRTSDDRGSSAVLALLLACGASPSLRGAGFSPRMTVLHLLCGGFEFCEDELEKSVRYALLAADESLLEIRDSRHGATPLAWAARAGRVAAVRVLVKFGADPHVLDGAGRGTWSYADDHPPPLRAAIKVALESRPKVRPRPSGSAALLREPAVASVLFRRARVDAARAALAFCGNWGDASRGLPAPCLALVAAFLADPTGGTPRIPRNLAERATRPTETTWWAAWVPDLSCSSFDATADAEGRADAGDTAPWVRGLLGV